MLNMRIVSAGKMKSMCMRMAMPRVEILPHALWKK